MRLTEITIDGTTYRPGDHCQIKTVDKVKKGRRKVEVEVIKPGVIDSIDIIGHRTCVGVTIGQFLNGGLTLTAIVDPIQVLPAATAAVC